MSPVTPTHSLTAAGWALTCLLAALSCLLSPFLPAAQAGEEMLVEGVLHVRNPAAPPGAVEVIQVEEQWRAGGDDDEVFFGAIAQALADDEGNLYLLDGQLSEVQVYSPTGEFLKTLSREGDGPGEVRRPGDMFFLPAGEIGLVQSFPGKVVKIDREGIPAGTMNLSGTDPSQGRFGVLARGMSRGGNIILAGFHMSFGGPQGGMDQQFFLASCDEEGTELCRYEAKEYPIDYGNASGWVLTESGIDFVWGGRMALGPDGRVYTAPERNRYAVFVRAPDGTLERVIEREYRSRQRIAEEKQETVLNLKAVGRNYPLPPREVAVEDTDPDIASLRVTPDGQLWVGNSHDNRDQPEGILATFDVFDPAGHYRNQVQIACPGDPEQDALLFPGRDLIVVITGATDAFRSMQGVSGEESDQAEERAPMEVICYRMAP